MIPGHSANLWAFARGDTAGPDFERWLFRQDGLEAALGSDLHWDLVSADYADREIVWDLRKAVRHYLEPLKACECPAIPNRAAIPMGGDYYFVTVWATLDDVLEYGPGKWWLYFSRCRACDTVWLIAQDGRFYDEFFFIRSDAEALAQARSGQWPEPFQTYESVLAIGRELSTPPTFLDPSTSLKSIVDDLLIERPDIAAADIAHLLGLSRAQADRLVDSAESDRRAGWWWRWVLPG